MWERAPRCAFVSAPERVYARARVHARARTRARERAPMCAYNWWVVVWLCAYMRACNECMLCVLCMHVLRCGAVCTPSIAVMLFIWQMQVQVQRVCVCAVRARLSKMDHALLGVQNWQEQLGMAVPSGPHSFGHLPLPESAATATIVADDVTEYEVHDSCRLAESIWDAFVVVAICEPGESRTAEEKIAAAWAMMLLLVNLILQGMFSFIVNWKMAEAEFTEDQAQAFRTWRRNIAHDLSNVDPISKQSLAARVCGGEDGLSQASTQKEAYENITVYNTNMVGPILLVLVCWTWYA